ARPPHRPPRHPRRRRPRRRQRPWRLVKALARQAGLSNAVSPHPRETRPFPPRPREPRPRPGRPAPPRPADPGPREPPGDGPVYVRALGRSFGALPWGLSEGLHCPLFPTPMAQRPPWLFSSGDSDTGPTELAAYRAGTGSDLEGQTVV